MTSETDLVRSALTDHIDRVEPPAGDLTAVQRQGRRLRRRRAGLALGVAAAMAALVVAVGVAGPATRPGPADDAPEQTSFPSLGHLDLSDGLRAYAGPSEVHLGGRTFAPERLSYLDFESRTAVAANQMGVVFLHDGKPHLLGRDGEVLRLGHAETATIDGFEPMVKVDAVRPWAAWALAAPDGESVVITVYDLAAGHTVVTRELPCTNVSCADVGIHALDRGSAFVRAPGGDIFVLEPDGSWSSFASGETWVADVRNGVVLYDGAPPTGPAASQWRLVRGLFDTQLTLDGAYVVDISSTLESTTPGEPAVRLERGRWDDREEFLGNDTDGSVLFALGSSHPGENFPVFDCEIPSGRCEKLSRLPYAAQSPAFLEAVP